MYEALCCAVCREPIPARRALSAKYCGQKCKNKALTLERHAERLRRKLDADRIIRGPRALVAVFHRELMRAAPPRQAATSWACGPGSRRTGFHRCAKGQKYRHTLRGRWDGTRVLRADSVRATDGADRCMVRSSLRAEGSAAPAAALGHQDLAQESTLRRAVRPLPFNLRTVPTMRDRQA